jgi:hypothetical protein
MENCFETMASLSDPEEGWIWNTRQPTAETPLLVDIGPGTFGLFECRDPGTDSTGYTTLRGAGRENTIIAPSNPSFAAVGVTNCRNLEFIDLTIQGSRYGVRWDGLGNATWTNIDLLAVGGASGGLLAWAEGCDGVNSPDRSVHYFFGSRIRAIGSQNVNRAYWTECAETWFFGGEILLDISGSTGAVANEAILLEDWAIFEAFGTAIRARKTQERPGAIVAVAVANSSTFHSHGVNIAASVDASVGSNLCDATALDVRNGNATAHTYESSYVVTPSASKIPVRLKGTVGKAQSPFHWQAGRYPPGQSVGSCASSDQNECNVIDSRDGMDTFVETDCHPTSGCDNEGNEPHPMIYAETLCGSTNPWFDTIQNACRSL